MLFIPATVWEWWEWYSYQEKHQHTAPPFHERDPRYAAFERYYRGKFAEYSELVKAG